MSNLPRLLFVSPRFLFPVDSGGKIRTTQILRGLNGRVFDITLLSPAPAGGAERFSAELAGVADRCVFWPERACGRLDDILRMRFLFSALPIPVVTDISEAGQRVVAEALADAPDIVVFDFPHSVVLAPKHIAVPSVIFTHNVEAEIFRRHIEVNRNPLRRGIWKNQAKKMECFETTVLRRFDTVVAVSGRDKALLEQACDLEEIRVIRTGVDLDFFSYREPGSGCGVVFTGSMDWLANIDGIEFFMDEAWPLVTRQMEGACMTVVGRDPPAHLTERVQRRGLPWRLTGIVDDVRSYVREAVVYVIPLRVGGGTRLKVFEAMAMGCPVVSTTLGVEGLGLEPGRHYLRADSADEFADAVVKLLQDCDLRGRLSREARQYVEENCSFRKAADEFGEICLDTMNGKRLTPG